MNKDSRMKEFEKHKLSRFPVITAYAKKSTRAVVGSILKFVRTGPETVVLTPPVARGGNWLYEWLRAEQIAQDTHSPAFLIETQGMEPWLAEFPKLKELTKDSSHLRFRSMRVIGVSQKIRELFSDQEVNNFIDKYLLSDSFVRRQERAKETVTSESLVINIRRGDYYSNPVVHRDFGIDTVLYVKTALDLAVKDHAPNNIVVVSDDLNWCKENLAFLTEVAPTTFEKLGSDMFDDLAAVSVASRLILTNTTFGYWGAYIANRAGQCSIYAPNIHERDKSTTSPRNNAPHQHQTSWIQVAPPAPYRSWLETDAQ